MILNLNPEQFLTVYNSVSSNGTITAQEVKVKMDAQLLDALSLIDDSKNQSKFDSWIKKEKQKVDSLESELKSLKVNTDDVSIDDGLYFPMAKKE